MYEIILVVRRDDIKKTKTYSKLLSLTKNYKVGR